MNTNAMGAKRCDIFRSPMLLVGKLPQATTTAKLASKVVMLEIRSTRTFYGLTEQIYPFRVISTHF